ncbi:unnamed protein product [Vicia faba]|uniref:Uncharacterized protein n=1 Tax=Vicia faba TaxID=3906 RepID=A0AAV1AII5_VICFA|nr:unnamed protein product [Vicia faba]
MICQYSTNTLRKFYTSILISLPKDIIRQLFSECPSAYINSSLFLLGCGSAPPSSPHVLFDTMLPADRHFLFPACAARHRLLPVASEIFYFSSPKFSLDSSVYQFNSTRQYHNNIKKLYKHGIISHKKTPFDRDNNI